MPKQDAPLNYAEVILNRRTARGWTQAELAERLGVTNVTVSRWEKRKMTPSPNTWEKFLTIVCDVPRGEASPSPREKAPRGPVDFLGDGIAVRALIEGERLAFGHLANPAFATEISKIDPLPHQRIAVYEHMLTQPRLRFLLADDAGAGKTIMTGLYIREMLARRLIKRILIVPPAGLVGNWQNELIELFGLEFSVVEMSSSKKANPFVDGETENQLICSVDTLRGDRAFSKLSEEGVAPYDLVVFDEAHKLSCRQDADLTVRRSARYELAEALAGVSNPRSKRHLNWSARHLLLLTATPHMGKEYPYFALWRLLEPQTFSTLEAFTSIPKESRERFFVRRTKEEMITFDGKPLYPKRNTDTFSYELTQGEVSEQALYDKTTEYLRFVYNLAKLLKNNAAQLALGVFQRRLASSTYALLRSLERRAEKLDRVIDNVLSGRIDIAELARRAAKLTNDDDPFDARTADEEKAGDGEEENEQLEETILGSFVATTIKDLQIEKEYVTGLIDLARAVQASGQESKFDRLRSIIEEKRFRNEKLLVFTEHRDTLSYLTDRLEGLGFTGQIASIHGGMHYQERGRQVAYFRQPIDEGGARIMVCTDAAGEGINLQFCWVMVNYDVPWNPARLEQRMGRIHRYGQKRSDVFIINLVAGTTREGRVVKTLLDKMEVIRKELKSEKVFDVIGRVFEGTSITDYMRRALGGEDLQAVTRELGGRLTKEQVTALAEQERHLYGGGGDVAARLPGLKEKMASEVYSQLLPGYVRQFVQDAAPVLHLRMNPVSDGERFRITPARKGALDPLLSVLAGRSADHFDVTFSRPSRGETGPLWLHPGEPAFDRFRDLLDQEAGADGWRGAVFVDPQTRSSSLLHLAKATIIRRTDPTLTALGQDEVLENTLVGIRQSEDGSFEVRPVEEFLLLEPRRGGLPPDAQRLAVSAAGRIEEARAYLIGTVARDLSRKHRNQLNTDLAERIEFVRQGFFYEQKQLVEARAIWSKRRREAHPSAEREIERIREQQRAREARFKEAEETILREPALIGVGPVEFIAHVLVRPAGKGESSLHFDEEVERIAMEIAMAHERALGATVHDVHTPELALKAGLNIAWPGFDMLSLRPDGSKRCIEVKGSAKRSNIHISSNEWAAAANRRLEYWLYTVFDCASASPQLVAVQDPFRKLIEKADGFELAASEILKHGQTL